MMARQMEYPVFKTLSGSLIQALFCSKSANHSKMSPQQNIGCVRLAALGLPRCVAVFFPRTNVGNYLHTFVLERKNATQRVPRLVNNARDRPPVGVYIDLHSQRYRDTQSNALADVIGVYCLGIAHVATRLSNDIIVLNEITGSEQQVSVFIVASSIRIHCKAII